MLVLIIYLSVLNDSFVGMIIGFIFTFIVEIELLTKIALIAGFILSSLTLLSILSGLLNFLIRRKASRLKNSFLIMLGVFNPDTAESAFSNLKRILSRFMWELPQTLVGYVFVQAMNCVGRVEEVRFIAGVNFCLYYQHSNKRQGVSIGNFIYVSSDPKDFKFERDPLLLHEYGHHLQSRRWGWLYLFVIGIPSLISAIRAKPLHGGITTHDLQWYEIQANQYAAFYLKKNFDEDWTQFEPPFNSFPRTKFKDLT